MFGYEYEGDVWLCCRMTDGSSRSIDSVVGSLVNDGYGFDFTPNPLPTDVTSPEQVEFEFLDGGPNPPFPSVSYSIRVVNFEIFEGAASYTIEILVEGVNVTKGDQLVSGDKAPLYIAKP